MASDEKTNITDGSPSRVDDAMDEASMVDYELSPAEDKAVLRKIDRWYGMPRLAE